MRRATVFTAAVVTLLPVLIVLSVYVPAWGLSYTCVSLEGGAPRRGLLQPTAAGALAHPGSSDSGGCGSSSTAQRSAQRIGFIHLTNSPVSFDPADDSLFQLAMLHIYDYTQRHGYGYLRVVDTSGAGHLHGVWVKPKHLSRALQEFDLLVLVDADVLVPDPSVPVTTLLERWGFGERALVLMALDPANVTINYVKERSGAQVLMANTGFMVLRNHPKVAALLDQWYGCRRAEPSVAACNGYNFTGVRNQPVWNLLMRPQLGPGELVLAPCAEANGFPPSVGPNLGCNGTHVAHAWHFKEWVQRRLAQEFNASRRAELLPQIINGGHIRLWL